MANRFDQPAQANFVNTYVPIPFEELSQAAMLRRETLEQGRMSADMALSSLEEIEAIPTATEGDLKRRNELVQDATAIRDEFVGADFSDPEVNREFTRKFRQKVPKSEVQRIMGNREAWDKNQEMLREMKAKGLYHPALDMDPANSPTFGAKGEVYDYMQESLLDSRAVGERYFDNIDKDQWINEERGTYVSERSPDKIAGVAKQRVSDFMDTAAGMQAVRIAASREGINLNELEPDERREVERGMAYQALLDIGQEYVVREEQLIPGLSGGRRNDPSSPAGTPVSNWRGADYEGTSLEAIKRDVADSEADIASQERRGREVPAIEKNKLAEQKGVLEEAEVVKRDYVKENTAVLLDSLYDSLSDLSGDAKAMFKKHIELNLDKPLVKSSPVPGSPMGRDNTNYGSTVDNPGAFQLSLDLSESDLSGKEKRKILKAYSKYFDEKATVQNEAEQREEEYAKESLSTLFQTRYNLPAQYFEDDGVLQYEIQTVDASGNPKAIKQQSVIDRIFKDIPMQMDTNAYKIEVPKEGPNKADNLLKKVDEGSLGFSPRTSGINWTLGGEYGSDIVFETGLFKMKDGKPTSVKESDVKLYINDPTMKDAVIAELVNMGERNAAYYLSPWAYSINHRVKNAEYTEDPTQRIDLVGEGDVYAVVTKKSPQHYDVTWFDRDNKPRGTKQDVRGINAVSNFLNSEVFKIVEHEFHKFGWAN